MSYDPSDNFVLCVWNLFCCLAICVTVITTPICYFTDMCKTKQGPPKPIYNISEPINTIFTTDSPTIHPTFSPTVQMTLISTSTLTFDFVSDTISMVYGWEIQSTAKFIFDEMFYEIQSTATFIFDEMLNVVTSIVESSHPHLRGKDENKYTMMAPSHPHLRGP